MKNSLGAKTLLYPTPVCVIGTYDTSGKPNVMTAAWVGICCSSPPCIAVSLLKATYTFGNIMNRKAFTVCIPSEEYAKHADYFGMVSGKDVDKFAASGLTPQKSEVVNAPLVKEFPVALECRLQSFVEIGLHTEFIGGIMDVKSDEACLWLMVCRILRRFSQFCFLRRGAIIIAWENSLAGLSPSEGSLL